MLGKSWSGVFSGGLAEVIGMFLMLRLDKLGLG